MSKSIYNTQWRSIRGIVTFPWHKNREDTRVNADRTEQLQVILGTWYAETWCFTVMTQFFLIRHGANDWLDHRLAGWTPDVHLNDAGRVQAEGLVERLAPVPLDAIYSSPLDRAVETAAPLAQIRGLEIQSSRDLGEVNYGSWQGASLKELARKKEWTVVRFTPSAMRFPDGESLREMQSRAVTAIERIAMAHPKGTVAVFSHGDVIKAVVAHFVGMPLDMFQRLIIAPASVSVLVIGEFGARLVRLNDTGPFQPPSKNGRKAKRSA